MNFKQIHQQFSFNKLFKLVLGMAVVLQLVVISYNHFSGYHHLNGLNELVFRVLRGIFYSMIAGFAIAYPDILVIRFLNKRLQWNSGVIIRVFVQFAFMLLIAITVSSSITLFANWLHPYRQGLMNVLINNMLIYSVVNAFFMSILEASIYHDESTKDKMRAEELQRKLLAEAERNYKEMMDLLPQPVFELNMKGEVVFGNKTGYEFFGPQPDDPNKRISALECFIEEDRPRIIENFKKTTQGLLTEPSEFTAIKADGTHCPVMVYGNPIMKDGEIVGRRGIIVDISERKKQEQKIIQAKQELEHINSTLEQSIAERTKELTEANTQLLKAQKENLQSQFEVLKQQVNPYFLFNSLNVLSSLISKDVSKAQLFIDEFSQIYRYVLETIEKTVVTLGKELGFVRSYIFLQQIRYGENLIFTVNLPSELLKLYMPPLSLQVVLENAIKHNIVNESHALHINISHADTCLIVSNSIQAKISMGNSTGLGQKNMVKRYAIISDKKPTFEVINNQYAVKLPLLNIENDESTDH